MTTKEQAVEGVVEALVSNPPPAPEPEDDGFLVTAERDRKRNAATQKLLRQVEQRVKEVRLYTQLGLTCDDINDKRHAVDRIGQLSRELALIVDELQDTV